MPVLAQPFEIDRLQDVLFVVDSFDQLFAAVEEAGADQVVVPEHVVMGTVLQAGQGQIPSRQAQIERALTLHGGSGAMQAGVGILDPGTYFFPNWNIAVDMIFWEVE